MKFPLSIATATAAALTITPIAAQIPNASTAGLGMADNYTAAARGYNATRWNPANLALTGNPAATVGYFMLRAGAGLGPITLADLAEYSGADVPASVLDTWLEGIRADGKQGGAAGADLTFLAAQFGRIGVHAGTALYATADVPPGAAQLVFFGNVDPATGQTTALSFDDASVDAFVGTTIAVAYAHPFNLGTRGDRRFSIGGTIKYTFGHFLLTGNATNSQATADPVAVRVNFPTVTTDLDSYYNNGGGIGFDLGGALEFGSWTVGGAVQNVFNTFVWKEEKLRYRAGSASFTADSSNADFDMRGFAEAPAALREQVLDLSFKPQIALGVSYHPNERLTVASDFRTLTSDEGLITGPRLHAGVGAEYRVLSWLPVRAGVAMVTGGTQVAGGIGFDLGAFTIAASAAAGLGQAGSAVSITLLSNWPGQARY